MQIEVDPGDIFAHLEESQTLINLHGREGW
jgi:hypothetical protein